MAKKKALKGSALSDQPQKIDAHNWYYEERKGIQVIHQVYDVQGGYIKTDFIMIPWSKLSASLKRFRGEG